MNKSVTNIFCLLVITSMATTSSAGDFALEPAVLIEVAGEPIEQEASLPLVVDWNSDGKKDLLVGWFNYAANGKLFIYLNVGTDSQPVFDDHVQPTGVTLFDGG